MGEIPPASTSTRQTSSQTRTQMLKMKFPDILECSYISKLGEGAYGNVYLVSDKRSETLKACKAYDFKRLKRDYMEKFAPREIDILLKVSHPNIIGVHRMVKAGTYLYMIMDYAEKKDLEHYISKACNENIHENQARIWIRQIANALEYLHEVGIVHRDIKCENILISRLLNAKLADFGFSRLLRTPKELSNTFCGTTSYAAPEIIRNSPYNPKLADIWSLGVVLYRILNKKYPFGDPGTRNRDVLKKQEGKEYLFNRKYEISIGAKQLIGRMLEPNPKHRPNAKDVQNHAWIQNEPTCQTMTAEEREALKIGKLKSKVFMQKYTVVQALTSSNNVDVTEENKEKKYPDSGESVSDQSILVRVCKENNT
ncbi:hypothetical protein M8J76_001897 [Diaphorina citri]|nr:hypothetical protein M8J75_005081 [Diaphorina citri]KAI5729374.1 hypothetical protein M8J76_001897 [Diaphorina citri]